VSDLVKNPDLTKPRSVTMNKTFATISMIVILLTIFIAPNVASATDNHEESPLKTERYKNKYGWVVRNEFSSFAHTCMGSNADSRASARDGVCFIETKMDGKWQLLDHNASRDASIWRSLPNTILTGTGAAFIQGKSIERAAEVSSCGGQGCQPDISINNHNRLDSDVNVNQQIENRPTIGVNVGVNVAIPCSGICPGG